MTSQYNWSYNYVLPKIETVTTTSNRKWNQFWSRCVYAIHHYELWLCFMYLFVRQSIHYSVSESIGAEAHTCTCAHLHQCTSITTNKSRLAQHKYGGTCLCLSGSRNKWLPPRLTVNGFKWIFIARLDCNKFPFEYPLNLSTRCETKHHPLH